jgi:hypothetical protein
MGAITSIFVTFDVFNSPPVEGCPEGAGWFLQIHIITSITTPSCVAVHPFIERE